MSFLDQIPAARVDDVLSLLKRGKFNLLLGAGASADSFDQSGTSLPLSGKLASELAAVGTSQQIQLADAYDIARERNPEGLQDYLAQRFTNCNPAPWWDFITGTAWRRIWTLNIDDVVEQAFLKSESGPRLSAVYSWADPVATLDGIQLVHLHGKVSKERPLELIFSIQEYAEAIDRKHGWHRAFFDSWIQEPFITIGASLFSEYDLAAATRTRRSPALVPSLYVSRSVPQAMREQLDLRNLIAIESSAELQSRAPLRLSRLRSNRSRGNIASPPFSSGNLLPSIARMLLRSRRNSSISH